MSHHRYDSIVIGDRRIGKGCPCFVIAEAGVNHNGDLSIAEKLIDAAIDAGADAVKFQSFIPEGVVTEDAPKAEYQNANSSGSTQLEMIRTFQLPLGAEKRLQDYSRAKNIFFLSTPFDEISAERLNEIGVGAYKIASPDLVNYPLLRRVAGYGKPIIVSTGLATLAEVRAAVDFLAGIPSPEICLLHCVSMYPAPMEKLNLRAISTLLHEIGVPVGFSDHSMGIVAAAAAAAIGACVVEKHLTLDRRMAGPDHAASLEPERFAEMVRAIREVESALGSGIKEPADGEAAIRAIARRGLVAASEIPANAVVVPSMIVALRPEQGIPPTDFDLLVGRKALARIPKGASLQWDMFT